MDKEKEMYGFQDIVSRIYELESNIKSFISEQEEFNKRILNLLAKQEKESMDRHLDLKKIFNQLKKASKHYL